MNFAFIVAEEKRREKCIGLWDCNCIFTKSMPLPCRQIFALRNKQTVGLAEIDQDVNFVVEF